MLHWISKYWNWVTFLRVCVDLYPRRAKQTRDKKTRVACRGSVILANECSKLLLGKIRAGRNLWFFQRRKVRKRKKFILRGKRQSEGRRGEGWGKRLTTLPLIVLIYQVNFGSWLNVVFQGNEKSLVCLFILTILWKIPCDMINISFPSILFLLTISPLNHTRRSRE